MLMSDFMKNLYQPKQLYPVSKFLSNILCFDNYLSPWLFISSFGNMCTNIKLDMIGYFCHYVGTKAVDICQCVLHTSQR